MNQPQERRRALHITTGLELGGAEQMLLNCAVAGRARGYEPLVIALKSGGPNRRKLEDAGIEVIELGLSPIWPDPIRFAKALRVLGDFKPHIVKSWMYHANLFASAMVLAGRGVSREHFMWGIYNSWLELDAYKLRLRWIVEANRRLARFPSCAIYNSVTAAREHRDRSFAHRDTMIINNGIDLMRFVPSVERRNAARLRLGIAPDAKVAIIVARHDPQKDWATVLAGISRLDDLVTVAVGPTTSSLPDVKGLIRHGQHLTMEDLYPIADCFILPSAFGEGTSVAMCEAMACGIPPIVTDVGDNARYTDGAGLVIQRGSPDELAAALRTLFADAALRAELGAKAREQALMHFGPGASFGHLFDRWDQLCAGTRVTSV